MRIKIKKSLRCLNCGHQIWRHRLDGKCKIKDCECHVTNQLVLPFE